MSIEIIYDKTKLLTSDSVYLTAKDLKSILLCGINRAYDYMKSPAFPSTKINGRYYVSKAALLKWLEKYEGRTFII